MGRITGVANIEFIGLSVADGIEPIMVQPGETVEVISENGGFSFRHEDGNYYATQELSVDEVLHSVFREDITAEGPKKTPVKKAKPEPEKIRQKITYDDDDLLLIF